MKYLRQQTHWIVLREVTVDAPDDQVDRRRIDVLLISHKRTGKVPRERIALEIKVTRADFKRDTPEKRAAWMELTHKFAYVTPKGLITKAELPPGCGLIEYDPESFFGKLAWKVNAPVRPNPKPFDQDFFHYLTTRLSTAEHKARLRQGSFA